jgi:acyl-CoA synthetase (AMP-forming)/AMP-acid ligase II
MPTVQRGLSHASVPAMLTDAFGRFGDAAAIADDDGTLTFAGLGALTGAYARAVAAQGLGSGDVVAVWVPNSGQAVAAIAGALSAGTAVTRLSTRLKGGEASYALRTSGARLLLTVRDCVGLDLPGMLGAADPELAGLPTVRLDDRGERDAFLATGSSVAPDEIADRGARVGPDDTAFLLFTSGTTGRPKGAMVPHRAGVASAAQERAAFGLGEADRSFVVLPVFHVFGLTIVLAGLTAGATTRTTAGAFDPDGLVGLLERERITFLPGPPPIFDALLAHPGRAHADLGALRCAFVASTSIPGALLRRLHGELGLEVVTGYGLTEGIIVSLTPRDAPIDVVATTAGRVLDEVDLRVVDDAGQDVPAGTPGEFWVRTPSTTTGYFRDAEATRAAFAPGGWLRTGDVGTVDADGLLRVTDRKKDMFIVGGFNAYPAEIEAILGEHPGVAQAAVIGVPDARMGEVGVAFVVPGAPGLRAEDLLAWAREQMANYKVPRHVELVDELPLTASMKVAKFELRDRFAERLAQGAPS